LKKTTRVLNIFYEEPDEDRWFAFDRYPRRIIRRALRGKPRPGGQARVFLNLCAGLDRIGVRYRINDYLYAQRNPNELACIVGKTWVLDKARWKNPILLGSAIYSHPIDDPDLLTRLPIKKVLVPGPWMKRMCEPYWGDAVHAWPVGIDTSMWDSATADGKDVDVLIYDKVHWDYEWHKVNLIDPIRRILREWGHSFREIRYGFYQEEDFRASLARCRTMIFLGEHETQGIAYQQALSCGVPIIAWDRGGFWRDPAYFPDRVMFEPVTSVPYWDDRCGQRFSDFADFEMKWDVFWFDAQGGHFTPREYILENLTLEKCARDYVEIAYSLGARV
jgi:hypothetical protein